MCDEYIKIRLFANSYDVFTYCSNTSHALTSMIYRFHLSILLQSQLPLFIILILHFSHFHTLPLLLHLLNILLIISSSLLPCFHLSVSYEYLLIPSLILYIHLYLISTILYFIIIVVKYIYCITTLLSSVTKFFHLVYHNHLSTSQSFPIHINILNNL